MTYGERFHQLRKTRWRGTVLELAKRLGEGDAYTATIYNIEKQWRVPALPTIEKHAHAIGCHPWELLQDVETEYDTARALSGLPRAEAQRGWNQLIERYKDLSGARVEREGGRCRGKPPRLVVGVAENPPSARRSVVVMLSDYYPFWAPCDCWRARRRCLPRLCMPAPYPHETP